MNLRSFLSSFFGLFLLTMGVAILGSPRVGAAGVPLSPKPAGVTLADCYQKARQISETLGISEENIRALEAQYRSKLGSVMPHVDWIKTQFYQDKASPPGGGGASSTFLTVQPESYFQVSQPIFAGLRDWRAVDIAKSMQQQARYDKQQTDQQLLSDVATAFYTALTAEALLYTLQETRQLTQDRVKELEHWVAVGRSLPSDLLSARTQIATLDAQIADANRTKMESRELLRFLTGVSPVATLVDERPTPIPIPLEEAVNRSAKRPELMSQEEVVRQSQFNVRYAKGSYWPILGVLGKYYTERIGFETDVRWDALFTLDVPLFEGGSDHYQIQAARAQNIIAELGMARLRRSVEQQVRTAQQDLYQSIEEAQAFQKAVDMGQKNYEAQVHEYHLGRTSNIEVLQLLSNLQDVKRQWVSSKYASKLDDVLMRIAIGEGL